jgi:secreted Zn-dependent insulinase-like peptidase
MHSNNRWFLGAMSLALVAVAVAQTNDIATGNMHFSAKDMDTNGDQMISKDEFIQYEQKLWAMMSKGSSTISMSDAASDFARGNLRFNAKAMDADHDGNISKEEFLAYGEKKFDKMKNKDGMMTIEDATKNLARGNR